MEDREGVAAVLDAALREDDADEVHAAVLEEGEASGAGEVLNVGGGDVAYDVQPLVDDGYRA